MKSRRSLPRDPVRKTSANKRTCKGVNQGFETRNIAYTEVGDDTPKIGIWTEEDFEPQQVSIDHQYYCVKCKDFMHLMGVKERYLCLHK